MYWTYNSMNNPSSYFGLADARRSASDEHLPVIDFLNFSGDGSSHAIVKIN